VNENYENLDVAAPAGRDFSSLNTPPAGGAGGATTAPSIANGRYVKYVNSAEDLVFLTDTDKSDYPIYILQSREVVYKRKPNEYLALFYVKSVTRSEEADLNHELLTSAEEAIKDITKSEPKVARITITYEVYDSSRYLGETNAHVLKLYSDKIPYRGIKGEGKRAWAIAFDYLNRLKAKYPILARFAYCKSSYPNDEGYRGRGYPELIVKLPIVTEEFAKLFNMVLASATVSSKVSAVADLEEQVKKLEELIKQKEAELQALREQLQQLKLKLQLEQMKMKMVE